MTRLPTNRFDERMLAQGDCDGFCAIGGSELRQYRGDVELDAISADGELSGDVALVSLRQCGRGDWHGRRLGELSFRLNKARIARIWLFVPLSSCCPGGAYDIMRTGKPKVRMEICFWGAKKNLNR